MKKLILITSIIFLGTITSFGQYATDFNATDCDAVQHHLFSELDAGTVVVIAWVMPCATCIADPLDAFVTVNSYATSHPGRVVFYLVDDFADNTCQTLTSWAANYGMGDATAFSDPAIDMFKYGTFGMPKIVVLGGSHHEVYFMANNSSAGVGAAIDKALIGENTVGISKNQNSITDLKSFPNPANNEINVSYNLVQSSTVKLEVINTLGEVMSSADKGQENLGKHSASFDISTMSNGIYFINIMTNQGIGMIRFAVSR